MFNNQEQIQILQTYFSLFHLNLNDVVGWKDILIMGGYCIKNQFNYEELSKKQPFKQIIFSFYGNLVLYDD